MVRNGSGPAGCTSPALKGDMMTFTEKIAQMRDGGTVVMDKDYEEAVTVPYGAKVTIDLGGHTLTAPAGQTALSVINSQVNVVNGTIRSKGSSAIRVGMPGATVTSSLVLGSDVDIVTEEYVAVFLAARADLITSANITVTGKWGCIQGNGTETYWNNSASIVGGTIKSDGTAIYWPQVGSLSIKNGTITGSTGIEMRAGSLLMSGGTVSGTAAPTSVAPNGNGTTSDGVGIAIAQHTTMKPVAVNITGGKISGYSAVYQSNPEGNPPEAVGMVGMSLSGGTFEAINGGTVAVYAENTKGFITGGTYNTNLDESLVSPDMMVGQSPDGGFIINSTAWHSVDGGVMGGGFGGLRRSILTCDALEYKTGGFKLPLINFTLVAVIGASAKNGVDAWYDESTGNILLYRSGKEVSGTIEKLTLVMVGH